MHISFDQGTKHAFWPRAALEKQLTAALCHCNYTHASMPLIQVCKWSTLLHSSFDQGTKHAFWLSAALQKQLTAAL